MVGQGQGPAGLARAMAGALAVLAVGGCAGLSSTTPPPSGPGAARSTPPGPMTTVQPGLQLYADPEQQHILDGITDPAVHADLEVIATQPQAIWLTGSSSDADTLAQVAQASAAQGTLPVVVLYDIPDRDCNDYSAGGTADGPAYLDWVGRLVDAMDGPTWVILEPDALAASSRCGGDERLRLLHDAGTTLRSAGHRVYLDAGNARWLDPSDAAALLTQVGAEAFDGIALNVSNYETTTDSLTYAQAVSDAFGQPLHVVIDTSRNGNGPAPDAAWCNPPGRALGENPRVVGDGTLDALLWVKTPGESDGECRGGPPAGELWLENALELVRNAR
jgi:endoglucanase